jgi:hypothetical protein
MMAPYYHMKEVTTGLRVEVRQDWDRWQRLMMAGIAALAVGFPAAIYFGGWWWAILPCLIAGVVFKSARGKSAELQVTNVEFISRGDIGRRVRERIVCTGDVRRLEFRDQSTFIPRYQGLYAVTARGTTLLLPMLDFNATVEVIRAIESKFPGLAEGWHSAS